MLLSGNDGVEILLIDDGSTDRTAEIIDKYERTYPKQIKAVHQENGGHGQAINTGMYLAKGKYVKVVDSDDWLDLNSYQKVLNFRKVTTPHTDLYNLANCNTELQYSIIFPNNSPILFTSQLTPV